MRAVFGLYAEPARAERAFEAVQEAGVGRDEIVVMSPQPLKGDVWAGRPQKDRTRGMAALGGALGCLAGASLTAGTQLLLPLSTGGMPVVSVWPDIIITFELTMLGMILASVVVLIRSGRLGRPLPELYDPAVSSDQILVGVVDPPDADVGRIRKALEGGEIKTLP